jgi:protein-S-isoprenylcysteine O-methyltransferase Ste14
MPAASPAHSSHPDNLPSTIASLAVGAAFFVLWFWLLPKWLHFTVGDAGWRWIFVLPSVLGFAVALRSVFDFGHTGKGTPVPLAPPKRLVVVGFYRYVRNPMYVGFYVGWIGLWIIFGEANAAAIAAACAVVLGVHLFVVFYEEPHLTKVFGAEYREFCSNVPRWLPRVRPWEPGS